MTGAGTAAIVDLFRQGRGGAGGTLAVAANTGGLALGTLLAGGAAFAMTGVLTSVSALFLVTVLHDSSHALAGSVVAIVFISMAGGQLTARRTTPRQAMLVGCGGLALAGIVLLLALALHTLAALLIAAVAFGSAGGMCLNAGVATTVGKAREDQRGGVSSAYFAGLYVFLTCPAIGVGLIAAQMTLITAGVILCVLVIALAIVIAGFEFRSGD